MTNDLNDQYRSAPDWSLGFGHWSFWKARPTGLTQHQVNALFRDFPSVLRPKCQPANDLRLVNAFSRRAFTCAAKNCVIPHAVLHVELTPEAKSGVAVNQVVFPAVLVDSLQFNQLVKDHFAKRKHGSYATMYRCAGARFISRIPASREIFLGIVASRWAARV